MDVEQARQIAEQLLAEPLPQRWAHTQGVARRARELASKVGDDASLLEAAAWLHDIGYSPSIAHTGFHPLDGARYLRDVVHADEALTVLVAHHSCATYEAEERDLLIQLVGEFGEEPISDALTALTASDMTTSVEGTAQAAEQRLAEILRRYDRDSPVHRAISRAEDRLLEAARRAGSS